MGIRVPALMIVPLALIVRTTPAWALEPDTADSSIFGIRGGITHVRDQGRRPDAAAVTFNVRREGYGQEGDIGVRVLSLLSLGGGSEGVEGSIGTSFAGSYRAPVTKNQGPFARMGISAAAIASPLSYLSYIELPQMGLGYQYFAGSTLFEAGLKTGYVLTGHYRADNAVRPLGASFEWGAFAAMHVTNVQLTAGLARYLAGSPASSLDVLEAVLCTNGRYVAACADARFAIGDVNERSTGDPHRSRAMAVGFTIGTPEPRK